METEKLSFKLDVFEGPLDLLLHLIAKNKVDIYDIPIESITRQYFAYLNTVKELDLEVSSEFLVMASQLLYIKSKMLLPVDKTVEDDQPNDPRAELVAKLLDYKAYRELAEFLRKKEADGQVFYYHSQEKFDFTALDYRDQQFAIADLAEAFYGVIKRKQDEDQPFETAALNTITQRRHYSISDKIYEIKDLMEEKGMILFLALFDHMKEKSECIAAFLAILEMIKSSMIQIEYSYENMDFVLKDGVNNDK